MTSASPHTAGRRAQWLLVALLLAVACGHGVFAVYQTTPQLTGDELHYVRTAQDDARRGETLLLPGHLRFGHRPEFQSRVLAQWVEPDREHSALLVRASLLQLALLLGIVAMIFYQAKAVGLRDAAALAAAACVALFPWFGFHVHTLWPEILHAFCFAGMLLAALVHVRSGGTASLLLCGLATGAGLLVKGTLAPFVPLLALFFAGVELGRSPGRAFALRAKRAFVQRLPVYVAAVVVVVGPQLAANAAAGHGLRLAANRWWNLELGLTVSVDETSPAVLDDQGRWVPAQRQTERYAAAAGRAPAREAAARQRVAAYVADRGLGPVLVAQVGKLVDLLIASPALVPARASSFDRALQTPSRWGDPSPGWLMAMRDPARGAWWLLWFLGLAGLGIGARNGAQGLLLAGFGGAFLVAALAVPVKVRFLLPMVPVLALGVGQLVDAGAALLSRSTSARGLRNPA